MPVPPWGDARFELRAGLPGNLFGRDGNVLFSSQRMLFDFTALPQIGTAWDGTTFHEIALPQWGLTARIPLVPGATYSLVLVNRGAPGVVPFTEHQPSSYAGGGLVGHNVAYPPDVWAGPYDFSDLGFRVVGVPEPNRCVMLIGIGLVAWRLLGRGLVAQRVHPGI